jgi:predicted site-specific integrase-resolvase
MAIQHIDQRALAERWQLSETTLERWRSQGVGPVFLKLHGRIVYREQDLEAYENQCLRTSTSARMACDSLQDSVH